MGRMEQWPGFSSHRLCSLRSPRACAFFSSAFSPSLLILLLFLSLSLDRTEKRHQEEDQDQEDKFKERLVKWRWRRFFFEVSFFFWEPKRLSEKEKKPTRAPQKNKISRSSSFTPQKRPLLLRRGLPSSTFLAHLYDALKGIKKTHHHQNGNQRIAGTVEALLPRRASGTV